MDGWAATSDWDVPLGRWFSWSGEVYRGRAIGGLGGGPNASVLFSGAVNKSNNGASCFAMVVDNITINGTGEILKTGACAAAGLNLPTNNVGVIALVQ